MAKVVSFASKDARKATGLPSDFDATIVAAEFTREAPDGYPAQGNPLFAKISYLRRDIEGTKEERTLVQSYGLGGKAGDEFAVSEDGYVLTPQDDSITGLREGSKFAMWMQALEKASVPEAVLAQGSLKALIGLDGHWRRIEDAKLLGKEREFKDGQAKSKKFPPETLVLVKLLGMPGQASATTTAKVSKAAPAAAPSTGDLDTQTIGFLVEALSKQPTKMLQRGQLLGAVTKAAITEKNRTDIAKRATDEAFLLAQAETGLIVYNQAATPQTVQLAA